MYTHAFRKIAIIFCRKGSNKNADKAIEGAMREGGKLIVVLNEDQICKLLHLKDSGSEPSDMLFANVDEFLMTLSR